MSPQLWLLLGTLATAAATLTGTRWMIRQQARQTKTTDAQQIIDQLQEMRAADEERHRSDMQALESRHLREIGDVKQELAEVRTRVGRMEDRELASFDYMYALRAHIDQRRDPPPPPWPDVLMHRN